MNSAIEWSKSGIRPILIVGLVLLVVWPLSMDSAYELRIFSIVGIYALLGLGYQFIFGHAGALALTQGTFFGMGAYVSGILGARYGLGGELTLSLSMLIPALLATLIAAPVLRLESHYFALATLGIGQVVLLVAISWQELTGGSNGLSGIPPLRVFGFEFGKGVGILVATWICVMAGALVSWRITRGMYGAALQVSRENPVAAMSLGIDTGSLRFAMLLLSAVFGGIAGALYAHTIRVVSPESLEFPIMVACLTLTVVGGRTHVAGAIVGAILIVNLPEWFRGMGKYYLIAYGVALLAMIIAAPYGIVGLLEQWRARLFPEVPRPTPPAIPLPARSTVRKGHVDGHESKLVVEDVQKHFGGLKALDGVSLAVGKNEILGLIGPNGSGKTTLLNVVTGIYRADGGSVVLSGREIHRLSSPDIARAGIARTFQNINLVDGMSVLDNVAVARFGLDGSGLLRSIVAGRDDPAWLQAQGHAMHLLAALGVDDAARSLAGGLAYGLKRKVEIARALALQPSLLLLDEPAAGLNESEQLDLAQRLRVFAKGGLSILVIEHNMPFLMPLAHRIVCLDQGKQIAEGSPRQIQSDPSVIAAYLGAPSLVAKDPQ